LHELTLPTAEQRDSLLVSLLKPLDDHSAHRFFPPDAFGLRLHEEDLLAHHESMMNRSMKTTTMKTTTKMRISNNSNNNSNIDGSSDDGSNSSNSEKSLLRCHVCHSMSRSVVAAL
jgi:hypothetical protein